MSDVVFTRDEVVAILNKLSVNIGRDLIMLASQHEPRLRADPVRLADEEMFAAREEAERRIERIGST